MKIKKISAILAVILIVSVYAASIVFALIGSPLAQSLLLTSLFLTVVVPALLYFYTMFLRLAIRNKKEENRTVFEEIAKAENNAAGKSSADDTDTPNS